MRLERARAYVVGCVCIGVVVGLVGAVIALTFAALT